MKIRTITTILAAAAISLSSTLLAPANAEPMPSDNVDVYVTEGEHFVNGRQWRTVCEPYSQTERCQTDIVSTTVKIKNGKFVQERGWVFNNLTYKASPRSLWATNPLGHTGSWTSEDGRKWRTECDTALTGGNGCRSFIDATVVESYIDADGSRSYRLVNKEVFNNMVRFSTAGNGGTPAPTPDPTDPTPTPDPTDPTDPTPEPTDPADGTVEISDDALEAVIRVVLDLGDDDPILQVDLDEITILDGSDSGLVDISELNLLPNLEVLDLSNNNIVDISVISELDRLEVLVLDDNAIVDVSALGDATNLLELSIAGNNLVDLGVIADLDNLQILVLDGNSIVDISGLSGLTALVELSLAGNEIVNLDALAGLDQLTVLNLADNEIVDVSDLELLVGLEVLNLSENAIVDVSALVDLVNLDLLDLSDNNISILDRLVLEVLELLGVNILW